MTTYPKAWHRVLAERHEERPRCPFCGRTSGTLEPRALELARLGVRGVRAHPRCLEVARRKRSA